MSAKRKSIKKKDKKKRKSKAKRSHKTAFGRISKEKNIYKPIKKHKEKSNKKEELVITEKNNIDIKTYNIKDIYNEITINEEKINTSKTLFNNQIYENEFFDIIPIIGDGNCFYRAISYYFNKDENQYPNLRNTTYNYVKNNLTQFYEYCYVENNTYYIDIEEEQKVHKYILDDYVENIKKNGFFAGFIEINAMSILINRPIIILENINFDNIKFFYNKLSHFYNNEITKYEIKDYIFINFINKDHYQLLNPNLEFIKNRILKKTSIDYYIIKFNIFQNKIIDLRNDSKSIREDKDFYYNKKKSISSINFEKNKEINIKNNKKDAFINKNINKNVKKGDSVKNNKIEKNNGENKDYNKDNEKQSEINEIIYDDDEYYRKLGNEIPKYIEYKDNDKDIHIKIPDFPILISKNIEENYYSDIYKYLYILKHKIDVNRYPNYISEIKEKNKKENKKREFRKKCKKYKLYEKNKLCKKFRIKDKNKINNATNSIFIEEKNEFYRLYFKNHFLKLQNIQIQY